MGESIKCSMCDAEATVHLTQIVNNKIIKVDLCEACAKAKGVTDPEGFSLADLIHNTNIAPQESSSDLSCSECGMDAADFRRTGRLGCSHCFTVFASMLRPVLEDMHVGMEHKGKVPEHALSRQNISDRLKALESALASAISEEAYEEAAKFRDQIQEIKSTQATEEALNP